MKQRLNDDGERPDESQPPNNTSNQTTHQPHRSVRRSTQTTLQTISPIPSNPSPLGTWGDIMTPTSTTCRILYQNVNGISANGAFMEALELGDRAQGLDIDILCMSETNVDWRHKQNGHDCAQILRKFWNETIINQSSSQERKNQSYQPGGTMTIVGDPWSGSSTKLQSDHILGRWNEIEVQGRMQRKLMIITAYRPVKNNISRAGPLTSYAQQWHLLNRNSTSQIEPCQQFITDISKRVESLKTAGYGIILSIDANDSLCRGNAFSKWIGESKLIDTHVHRHGVEGEPATHARGSSRIDYILITPDLADYVTAAGILPLQYFHHSDHRALYIDIDMKAYLRGQLHRGHRFGQKGLISTDPRAVLAYRQALTTGLLQLNISQRLKYLKERITIEGFTPTLADQLDTLEREFTDVRLSSEKACKNIRSLPWSPALKMAQTQLRFWRMYLSEWKRGADFTEAKQRLWPEGHLLFPSASYSVIQSQLRQAQRTLHDVGLNSKALRQAHLEARAEAMSSEGRLSHEKAIRCIMRSEAMRDINKKLSRVFGKNNKSGLSHLLVADESGGHICVDDPIEIHRRLLHRNKQHFSQAEGTPFTRPPLTTLFGPYGTNEASQQLLDGNINVDTLEVSDATKSILSNLRRVLPPNSISCEISPNDIRKGKNVWRETTSVSPSGLHLGHDKAVIRTEPASNPKPTDERLSDEVFRLQSEFINLSLQHAHVYDRWTHIVNATIEKIPGTPLIEKLRVIHIIESDFNLTCGILFGRRLMSTAEANNALGSEQFGSRSEKTSLTPLLAKYCKFATARLTQSNMASFDNDAKSCYDRIVMLLASLCAQRLGMDTRACNLFLKTLDSTKYRVKTKHGISDDHYSTDSTSRIHGPGQGGRASPGIWAIISCLIMQCLQETSAGITVISPDLLEVITFFTSGFVDDVTLWIGDMIRSLDTGETPYQLLQELQESAQWWEQLLYATGGKLELSKCFYYLIHWSFDDEGVPHLTPHSDQQPPLEIIDSATGATMEISHRSSELAHKTLGVMINPSGDTKEETKRILEKSRNISRMVNAANLSPYEAQLALNTRIYPAVTYGLAVGTLTEADAHKAQSTFVRPIIQAMGFNQNTPLAVVYGPSDQGGIACKHIFSEQGRMQVSLIMQQIRMRSDTGNLVVALLKWAQLVSGMPKPIMEATNVLIPHLDNDPYLRSLRYFLEISKLGLHIPTITHFQPKRINDLTIMDVATSRRPRLSKRTLQRINRCRIFLRAVSMADITSADGLRICPHTIRCHPKAKISPLSHWPKQPQPGPQHRRTWRWFLTELCHYKSNNNSLLKPLGRWLTRPTRKNWDLFYDDSHDQAYAWQSGEWWVCDVIDKSRTVWDVRITQQSISSAEVDSFDHKIPLSYRYFGDNVIQATPPDSNSDTWTLRLNRPLPRTWRSYVNYLPPNIRDLLRHCEEKALSCNECSLLEVLNDPDQRLLVVSSSTANQCRGTYAWQISTATHNLWTGHGHARGHPMSHRRANTYGKLSWMHFLHAFATFFNTSIQCRISHYCDDPTLNKDTKFHQQLTRTWEVQQPDYDTVAAIGDIQAALKLLAPHLVECRFVKNHRNKVKKQSTLNHVEQLKSQVESTSLALLTQVPNLATPSPTIPWEQGKVYLLSHLTPITSKEQHCLRWQWRGSVLKSYLRERWSLSNAQIQMIDWESIAAIRSGLTPSLKVFSTKLTIGWLATGSRLAKYTDTPAECMQCGSREDTDHLLRCPHDADDWPDWSIKFKEFLESIHTEPQIASVMVHGVSLWRHENWETKPVAATSITRSLANAAQTQVGWGLFMRGILAHEWSHRQLAFLRQKSPTTTSKQATSWCKRVGLWLLHDAHSKWSARNQLVHAKSDAESGHISRAESIAVQQLQNIYAAGEISDNVTQSMLSNPQEETRQRPLRSLQHWIQSTALTVRKRASAASRRIELTHRDIRSYWRTPAPMSDTPEPPIATSIVSPSSSQSVAAPPSPPEQTPSHQVRRTTASKPNHKTKPSARRVTSRKAKPPPPPTQKSQLKLVNQPTLWRFGWRKSVADVTEHLSANTLTASQPSLSPHTWTSERIEREGGGSHSKVGRIRKSD